MNRKGWAVQTITINYADKEQDFQYKDVLFSTKGTLDPRGFQGQEGITTYFQAVNITVTLETEENSENIFALKETVEKRCPIYNLLKGAGVDLTTVWHKS